MYFTFVGKQPGSETDVKIDNWSRIKAAACEAIVESGGTITHHHAIGTDHRDWLVHEIGEVGLSALRAVKSALDPAGIMNPGKLVPPV